MSASMDLAKSGMLYGANFYEWKQRAIATLRVHGGDRYVDDRLVSQKPQKMSRQDSLQAASLIRALVHPDIMRRIPEAERSNARVLMQRLKDMCLHFRFLDLPAELRNRIYGFVIGSCDRVIIHTGSKTTTGYPNVTKICRQIRSEALPIFYSSTTFVLDIFGYTPVLAKTIQYWAFNVVQDRVRQLRSVSIKLMMREVRGPGTFPKFSGQEIRFTLERDGKLKVKYSDRLVDTLKAMLDQHVKNVERTRKLMGIPSDGRLLVLAFVTHQDIWASANLRLKPSS